MFEVSVVMSVHNFKKTPMRGIETMLSQSMRDYEFILIDDGSEGDTKSLLEDYARRDSRIKLVVNEKRLRLASSLNKAVGFAQGKYIARADVNIDYHPDRLKKQIDFLISNSNVDIVGSNFYWGIEGDQKLGEIVFPKEHIDIVRRLSRSCCICHPSVVFVKDRLVPYGPYKEGYGRVQDYNLWMRSRGEMKFHNIQAFLLTKWLRPNPWRELSRIECLKGNIRSRISGFATSTCIYRDIFYFPLTFMYLINNTWVHRLIKKLQCLISKLDHKEKI